MQQDVLLTVTTVYGINHITDGIDLDHDSLCAEGIYCTYILYIYCTYLEKALP